MKIRNHFIYVILLATTIAYAQKDSLRIKNSEVSTLATPFNYFLNGKRITLTPDEVENPLITYVNELEDLKNKRKNKNKILFTSSSLNYLFSKKLAAAFNASNDLTLQKYFFNIDPTENSLTIGYNMDNRDGDPLNPLEWVINLGAKVVTKNNFSTLPFIGDTQKSNLGFNFSFTKLHNGYITYRTKKGDVTQIEKIDKEDTVTKYDDDEIKLKRELLLYQYNTKVKDFNKSSELKRKLAYLKASEENPVKLEKKIKEFIQEKADELYFEMISEEIEAIESDKLYKSIVKSWTTAQFYIPFGNRDYNISPINSKNEATEVRYFPFNASVSYNFFYQGTKNISLFGKLVGAYKKNNTIEVNGSSEKVFQSIDNSSGTPTLTSPVKAIDVTKTPFNRFTTTSLKGEFAFFFIKNIIGISGALEKNFGDFDGVNYKIGIPFSLKDKEGKPTVNFEVQYKHNETFEDNVNVIGISTSFFFGDLIN